MSEWIAKPIKDGRKHLGDEYMGDLIRCRDCVYYRPYSDGKMDCDNLFGMADVDPDGYCSRAERREK